MKLKKNKASINYPWTGNTPFGKVKIYKDTRQGKDQYKVAWTSERGRQRQGFTDEVEAHARAEEILTDLRKGMSFRNAVTATKAIQLAEYEKVLAEYGKTLGDAVTFFVRSQKALAHKKIAATDAVQEYLATVNRKGARSKRQHDTVRHVLLNFAKAFNKTLNEITVKELDLYLQGVSECGRTRNNHLGYLKTFWRWAQEWGGYLAEGKLEPCKIKNYLEKQSVVEVFTPEEMETLLNAATNELRPLLALGAFMGARTSELEGLKWEDLDFESKTVTLSPEITKCRRRRMAGMPPCLIAWLNTYAGEKKGPILKCDLQTTRSNVCDKTGVRWKKNGLRRSYISMRMAQKEWDASRVAKECGNSANVIETTYKQLVKPSEAEKWFSLWPKKTYSVT